jgi:hypothetical protein
MRFPGLNSFERQIIHELADQLGLKHESKGEGKTRTITVQKIILKQIKPKKVESTPDLLQPVEVIQKEVVVEKVVIQEPIV